MTSKCLHNSFQDTATEMIETIWPLSNYPCGAKIASTEAEARSVSGLRTYVQELLKRSRTSYSTLQVALYYLILIQCFLPKQDLTKEQTRESHKRISLQCGRRMFLSALILAGKYLQDKSYSSRAWSKISGLGCAEINFNESEFLKAIGWRLHLPEELFTRWTDIVFKYSPARRSQSQSTSPASVSWKALIPRLTPKLDNLELFPESSPEPSDIDSGYESSSSKESSLDSPPLRPYAASMDAPSQLDEEINDLPSTLEPTPYDYTYMTAAPPPPVPSLGFLPTPVLTPANCNISTPAVSAYSANSRRSSMSLAMNDVRRSSLTRCTLDRIGSSTTIGTLCHGGRRSSLQHQVQTASPTSAPMDLTCARVNTMPLPTMSHRAMAQSRPARPAARRCVTMSSWGVPQEQISANMAFENLSPLPMRPCNSRTPAGKTPPSKGDRGHSPSSTDTVDHELVAFLNRNANQRRVAESQLHTPQRAPAQRASRKRERPLSMDLSNAPAVKEALTPYSESSCSETSSNSSTPRPPTAYRRPEIVVVDDDNAIGTPVACSAASTLACTMPNDLVSTMQAVKPAKKMQKIDNLHNFSIIGEGRRNNTFHGSTAQRGLPSLPCSIQAAASTLIPSRRGVLSTSTYMDDTLTGISN